MNTMSLMQAQASAKKVLPYWMAGVLALAYILNCFAPASDSGATARQTELFTELLSLKPENYDGPTPWMLEVWDTDTGLADLFPLPSGPGNAASAFFRLEQLYALEKAELAKGGEETQGVRLLLDAADMGQCTLTPYFYPEFDKATVKQPDFVVLRSYLQGLLKRGDSAHRAGNHGEAERCYRAAIMCGKHLTDDRVSSLVYMTGIIFKLRGAQALEVFWRTTGRPDDADAVKAYLAKTAETLRLLYWKANQGLNEFADFASLPCIIRIAAADKEPCWRKEAVMRLAILRHGVPDAENSQLHRNPLFEQAAEDALSSVAALDPDSSVRRMALWAAQSIRPEMGDTFTHVFE